jgi:hypothetical protein
MESPSREIVLNGNRIKVSWSGKQLKITCNDVLEDTEENEHVLYVNDIHTIMRCINDVRRETWEADRNIKTNGLSCIQETKKKQKLEKV